MTSRYVIGIDLGTTNCALSYIDTLTDDIRPKVLSVEQWHQSDTTTKSPLLPSFLYILPKSDRKREAFILPFEKREDNRYVLGNFARKQNAINPNRVVHSAKSWLCHGGVSRTDPILPWHSDEIIGSDRYSPVQVEAALLSHLRDYWNTVLATVDPDFRLDRQDITITVPASFDEVAQSLTLEAAKLSGFDLEKVRLLEEPQAAFYHWLTANQAVAGRGLTDQLPNLRQTDQTVLVVDMGGGTTDFSLFRVEAMTTSERESNEATGNGNFPGQGGNASVIGPWPEIKRESVSTHLLLGGDNIDLALAYQLEAKLKEHQGISLEASQWIQLIDQCRQLKEQVLETESEYSSNDPEHSTSESLHVSLAGSGSNLFSNTITIEVGKEDIVETVLDGFFPECQATARPTRPEVAIREFGLPYAHDSGVTKHLAGFLDGRLIDAVLFTGGSLKPPALQTRLLKILESWQEHPVVHLSNEEMDLAVAYGASVYTLAQTKQQSLITGGYSRAVFLEVQGPKEVSLVCIVKRGQPYGKVETIDHLPLRLVVDQPIKFQLYTSTRADRLEVTQVWEGDLDMLHPLPTLNTKASYDSKKRKGTGNGVDVALEVTITEAGILELACVEKNPTGNSDAEKHRWPLRFSLRGESPMTEDHFKGCNRNGVTSPADLSTPVKAETVSSAVDRIRVYFGKPKSRCLKLG